jgi:hypothetical protein
VGTAGAVAYGHELAWVCMVLVDPEARGRGLASRLVSDVLERVSGFTVVGLDATPKGRPVYARLGFVEGPPLARLEAGTERPAAPRARDVRALRDEDLASILRWDREVFGADRSRVLRFALASAPEYAWLHSGEGEVRGYCFGRHGHNAEQIGPVVARTADTAHGLVASALAARPDRRFFMDVTTAGRAMGADLGFREQRPFTRMYRGQAVEGPHVLYAVFGPEFG